MLKLKERKIIRAKVIADYMQAAKYSAAVVFTCGNAADALRNAGVDVIEISERGDLRPGKWWRPEEIRRAWPHLFDATSGHLPAPLMVRIAKSIKEHLGILELGTYIVPTGSGETIICLRMAYPDIEFTPIYNMHNGTRYELEAPLNYWVDMTGGEPELANN